MASCPRSTERDVVFEVVELAARLAGRRGLARRGRALRRAAARIAIAHVGRVAAHALARAQHLHGVGHDLGGVLVLAVLVLPLARLEAPFHVDLGALLQVLAGDLGQLAEEGHAVPLGLFLLVAVLVLPRLRGGDRDVRDRAPVRHVAGLGIAPEVADEDHLVDRCHCPLPFL
jgi:hypothetical protein